MKTMEDLVHVIARKFALQPHLLGITKLHKILWYVEVQSLRNHGARITHESFKKMPFGPFAEHLEEVVDSLSKDGRLTVKRSDAEFETTAIIGKGTPTNKFSDRQLRLIEEVSEWVVMDHTASTISEKTHDDLWEALDIGDSMPVEAAAVVRTNVPDSARQNLLKQLQK